LGKLDLGTTADPGNNKICRNYTTGTTAQDVHIDRDNLSVSAEWNYWRFSGAAPAVKIKVPAAGQTASTFTAVNKKSNSTDPVGSVGTTCQ